MNNPSIQEILNDELISAEVLQEVITNALIHYVSSDDRPTYHRKETVRLVNDRILLLLKEAQKTLPERSETSHHQKNE